MKNSILSDLFTVDNEIEILKKQNVSNKNKLMFSITVAVIYKS